MTSVTGTKRKSSQRYGRIVGRSLYLFILLFSILSLAIFFSVLFVSIVRRSSSYSVFFILSSKRGLVYCHVFVGVVAVGELNFDAFLSVNSISVERSPALIELDVAGTIQPMSVRVFLRLCGGCCGCCCGSQTWRRPCQYDSPKKNRRTHTTSTTTPMTKRGQTRRRRR